MHEWGDKIIPKQKSNWDTFEQYRNDGGNGKRNIGMDVNQGNFCLKCNAWRGCLGLEPIPELYIEHMVTIFREIKRVLRQDGQCFINISDTRSKTREWIGVPHKLVFALQKDGWRWEDEIVWQKPNPMPGSQENRCTRSHEFIMIMNKSKNAFWDADAIREKHQDKLGIDRFKKSHGIAKTKTVNSGWHTGKASISTHSHNNYNPAGRNARSVWTIATEPFPDAHFATFPSKLVAKCIKAGTSERGCCVKCGAPWERVVEKKQINRNELPKEDSRYRPNRYIKNKYADELREGYECGKYSETKTIGWQPICKCHWDDNIRNLINQGKKDIEILGELQTIKPCIVFDPFGGSGTVLEVANRMGRKAIVMDLKYEYCQMAKKRCYSNQEELSFNP